MISKVSNPVYQSRKILDIADETRSEKYDIIEGEYFKNKINGVTIH